MCTSRIEFQYVCVLLCVQLLRLNGTPCIGGGNSEEILARVIQKVLEKREMVVQHEI